MPTEESIIDVVDPDSETSRIEVALFIALIS